jgi:hypothetical protein
MKRTNKKITDEDIEKFIPSLFSCVDCINNISVLSSIISVNCVGDFELNRLGDGFIRSVSGFTESVSVYLHKYKVIEHMEDLRK